MAAGNGWAVLTLLSGEHDLWHRANVNLCLPFVVSAVSFLSL